MMLSVAKPRVPMTACRFGPSQGWPKTGSIDVSLRVEIRPAAARIRTERLRRRLTAREKLVDEEKSASMYPACL